MITHTFAKAICIAIISVILSTSAFAQQKTRSCFINEGTKTLNRVVLIYTSPVLLKGMLQTVDKGSNDTLTTTFTGTKRQARLFITFDKEPQLTGPDTKWTSIPWTLSNEVGNRQTLRIPIKSKIVNSTGQYRDTEVVFMSAK